MNFDFLYDVVKYNELYKEQYLKQNYIQNFNLEDSGKLCFYLKDFYSQSPSILIFYYNESDGASVLKVEERHLGDEIIRYSAKPGFNVFSNKNDALIEIDRRKQSIKKCNSCIYNSYGSVSFKCSSCKNYLKDKKYCSKIKEINGFEVSYSEDTIVCKNYIPIKPDQAKEWKGIDFHTHFIKDCEFAFDKDSKCLLDNKNDKYFLCSSQRKNFEYWMNKEIYVKIKYKNNSFYMLKKMKDILNFNFSKKEFISTVNIPSDDKNSKSLVYEKFVVNKESTFKSIKEFITQHKKIIDDKKYKNEKVFQINYRYKSNKPNHINKEEKDCYYVKAINKESAITKFKDKKRECEITDIKETSIRWLDIIDRRNIIK